MFIFGVFLSCKANARRSVHSHQDHFIITLIISDRRDTRGKWPLARNPDRSRWHRHTNWKFFWPQPMAPWTTGSNPWSNFGTHFSVWISIPSAILINGDKRRSFIVFFRFGNRKKKGHTEPRLANMKTGASLVLFLSKIQEQAMKCEHGHYLGAKAWIISPQISWLGPIDMPTSSEFSLIVIWCCLEVLARRRLHGLLENDFTTSKPLFYLLQAHQNL